MSEMVLLRTHPAARDVWARACHPCCVALVVGACLVLMRRSYWIDETATHYFVAGSWSDLWRRLALHPHMSPGYYVVLKSLGPLWLQGEPGLRWLSLVALGCACLLLHRLGSRLFGGTVGLHAAIVLAALPSVSRQAINARPYALGLLRIVAAAWLLVRWLDEGRSGDAAGLIVAGAAAVWVHFTMAVVLMSFVAYALLRCRSGAQRIRVLLGVGFAMALLVAPLLLRMSWTWRLASTLSFLRRPDLGDLASVLALPFVLLATMRLLPRRERGGELPRARTSGWALIMGWAFVPPLVLFVIASQTAAQVFVDRYLLGIYPAVALLVGVWLQRFGSDRLRAAVLASIVLVCVTGTVRTPLEDWRGAVEGVRALKLGPSTPIFLSTGFIEARDPALLSDPRYEGYLASPLFSYPVPGRVVLLPDATDSRNEPAIQELIDRQLEISREVLLLSRGFHPIVDWFGARVVEEGFTWRELGPFPGVRAVLAVRREGVPLTPTPYPP